MKSTIKVSRVYQLPYTAEKTVSRFIDLRLFPGEIDSIPELAGRPALRELVRVLNSNEGPFMTHGCAFALEPPCEPGGTIPLSEESRSAAHWCTSYVTFSYWQMSMNKEENYAALYEGFAAEEKSTNICFVIQPAYFWTLYEQRLEAPWGDMNATVCLVWVSGWGETQSLAQRRWEDAIKSLSGFVGSFKTSAQDDAGPTVSQHMLNESRMRPRY